MTPLPGSLPQLGLSYRPEWRGELLRGACPVVEVVIDHAIHATDLERRAHAKLATTTRMLPHGLAANLGCVDGPDQAWLNQAAGVLANWDPPWWSDHIAFTGSGGRTWGHLAPLPRTLATVRVLERNVRIVYRTISQRLLLENIACPVDAGGTMDEPDFVRAVADATGCRLLFDVANAWATCRNNGTPFLSYLDRFPLHLVDELHVAGHHHWRGLVIDSHAAPVTPPVWTAVEETLRRCQPQAIILERDQGLPSWDGISAELATGQLAIQRARGPHG